jgi:hypothetical protein
MKARLGPLLLVGLAVITLATGCNGANDVTGPGDPGQVGAGSPTPVVTPHPRPTPNPCRQFPADCD